MSGATPRGSDPAKTTTSAPRDRYSSLSWKSSTSFSLTAGARSLISVCSPLVGSSTAVLVRDSSRMRTKSLRIDSAVSCSTIRVPVAPPATPVAMTGWPSVFSVRATLTPLPPGSVVCSTVRCRRPRRKFGTESDLSIAALRVTVMITDGGSRNRGLLSPPRPPVLGVERSPAVQRATAQQHEREATDQQQHQGDDRLRTAQHVVQPR